ncbi:MAG: ADP-glyceromanno-heptose 6-epimerase [Bacteroidota bacterium]
MIILTGAAGFIGSCMAAKLNQEGFNDLILVDDFSREAQKANYQSKVYSELVPREELFSWMKGKESLVQMIIHLGARTDTSEQDERIFQKLNISYSQEIWHVCCEHGIPLIYASSAATYGDGSLGFEDSLPDPSVLKPLNPYGRSKNDFDIWALNQPKKPYFWVGLKFFNVYGPNEFHKGRMASVIFHAFNQIQRTDQLKLFRSHREDYADGEQKRDFVYVKDLTEVIHFFMHHRKDSGLYNLGTGQARTFYDLGDNVFKSLGKETVINFIDTPVDIRASYQYFTEANMSKLRSIGFERPFTSLEEGIADYVKNYLLTNQYM